MSHQNYFTYISLARAGSSWLQRYLHNHSTAQMSRMKEMHWFDEPPMTKSQDRTDRAQVKWEDFQARAAKGKLNIAPRHLEFRDRSLMRTDEDYRRFYTSRFDPDAVFGDITPSYGRMQTSAFKRVLAVFPEAKFLQFIRNPADHMWSRVAHMRNSLRGDTPAEEWMQDWLDKVENKTETMFPPQIYATATKTVSPDKIYTQFSENLFSDRADETLEDMCNFLEITGEPAANNTFTKNRGHYEPLPEHLRHKAVKTLAAHYHWGARMGGSNLPASWQRDMDDYL